MEKSFIGMKKIAILEERIDKIEKRLNISNKPPEIDGKFKEKLIAINGIGEKIALDILKVYPSESSLRDAIKRDEHLPFRDDIEYKLREKFK